MDEPMLDEFPNLSVKAELDAINCKDVVKCIFNLTDTDMSVLKALSEKERYTAQFVANEIGKDRTTAYRSLEKLLSCGLCLKGRKGGQSRGFSNVYQGISEKEIYSLAERKFEACYQKIKKVLQSK
jgi:predicted transcriptional regulator